MVVYPEEIVEMANLLISSFHTWSWYSAPDWREESFLNISVNQNSRIHVLPDCVGLLRSDNRCYRIVHIEIFQKGSKGQWNKDLIHFMLRKNNRWVRQYQYI